LQTALGAALAKSARDQAAFDRIVSAFFALDGPLSPFRVRIRSRASRRLSGGLSGLAHGRCGGTGSTHPKRNGAARTRRAHRTDPTRGRDPPGPRKPRLGSDRASYCGAPGGSLEQRSRTHPSTVIALIGARIRVSAPFFQSGTVHGNLKVREERAHGLFRSR